MLLVAASLICIVLYAVATLCTKDLKSPFIDPLMLIERGLWLSGIVIAFLAVARLRRSQPGFVALPLIVAGYLAVHMASDWLAFDARFALARSGYLAAIERIRGGQAPDHGDFAYAEGSGAGLRVAFYWYRGIPGNWEGIVYDPSDSLADTSLRSGQKSYFGGDLISSRHISGHWYLCVFT